MMIHRLHIASMAMAAAAVLASCADSYPGLDYTDDNAMGLHNSEYFDKTPIMVFINEQNFFSISATRGTGPFEKDYGDEYWKAKYRNAPVYVYAFRSEELVQGIERHEKPFTSSRWDYAGDDGQYNAIDCLLDGPNGHGMRMKFTDDHPGYLDMILDIDMDEDETVHDYMRYFGKYTEVPYQFFGYYLDSAVDMETERPVRDDGGVRYVFEVDGSQDIMCGYAPFSKEHLEQSQSAAWNDMQESEKAKVLNFRNFTAFAAHRAIYPVIDLKHQLVRLEFQVYPGKDNDEDVNSIMIEGIDVLCAAKCALTVAAENTSDIGAKFEKTGRGNDDEGLEPADRDKDILSLRRRPEVEGGILKEAEPLFAEGEEVRLDRLGDSGNGTTMIDLGGKTGYRFNGCLMVPAPTDYGEDKYRIRLRFKQKQKSTDADGNVVYGEYKSASVTYDVALKNGDFEKGKKYTITIAVYGYQNIKVGANIEPWHEGGAPIEGNEDEGEYTGW